MNNFDKIIDPYKQIQETINSLNPFSKIAEDAVNIFQFPIEEMKKSLKIIDNWNKRIGIMLPPEFFENFKEFGKQINDNLKKTPESLFLLAKYGWYLNFESEVNMPIQLGELIIEGNIEEVDKILMAYYEKKLDNIQQNLSEIYPDRKEIFSQIIAAQKEQKYFLTIPCILTQVDGICFDVTTKKYFITEKKDKKYRYLPEVATEFANLSDSIAGAFAMPILHQTAINSHESEIANFPVKLNRHLIMHGIDKEYGTKKNSLKCLSLLVYFSDMLNLIIEKGELKN